MLGIQIFGEMQIFEPPLSFSVYFLKTAKHSKMVIIRRLFIDTMVLSKPQNIFKYSQLSQFLYNFSLLKMESRAH